MSPLNNQIENPARRRFIWAVCGILAALSLLALLYLKERKLIRAEFKVAPLDKISMDCGVVLTGSAGRVREGFDLLEQGQIQKLVISGVNSHSTLKDLMPLWPYYPKVQEDTVFLEKRSETTYGNAVQSLPVVQALKCRDVVLITSQLHMFRAYQVFRPVFPDAIPLYKHGVLSHRGRFAGLDEFIEVIKSLFYRPWAYSSSTR